MSTRQQLMDSHSFVAKRGLIVDGDAFVSGTIYATFSGSISNAESASYALTASYALNGGNGGASVVVTSSAPSIAGSTDGDLWWNDTDGNLYIFYSSSNVWIPADSNTISYAQTSSYIDARGIDFSNIPVSQSGLQTGQLYNDNNFLKIA